MSIAARQGRNILVAYSLSIVIVVAIGSFRDRGFPYLCPRNPRCWLRAVKKGAMPEKIESYFYRRRGILPRSWPRRGRTTIFPSFPNCISPRSQVGLGNVPVFSSSFPSCTWGRTCLRSCASLREILLDCGGHAAAFPVAWASCPWPSRAGRPSHTVPEPKHRFRDTDIAKCSLATSLWRGFQTTPLF